MTGCFLDRGKWTVYISGWRFWRFYEKAIDFNLIDFTIGGM